MSSVSTLSFCETEGISTDQSRVDRASDRLTTPLRHIDNTSADTQASSDQHSFLVGIADLQRGVEADARELVFGLLTRRVAPHVTLRLLTRHPD